MEAVSYTHLDVYKRQGLEDPDEKVLEDMIRFANAAASIITSKKGALRCMPSEQEILKLIGEPHIDKEIKFTFS